MTINNRDRTRNLTLAMTVEKKPTQLPSRFFFDPVPHNSIIVWVQWFVTLSRKSQEVIGSMMDSGWVLDDGSALGFRYVLMYRTSSMHEVETSRLDERKEKRKENG